MTGKLINVMLAWISFLELLPRLGLLPPDLIWYTVDPYCGVLTEMK